VLEQILKKVRSQGSKQKYSQSSEERALQLAKFWPGFKEELESELSIGKWTEFEWIEKSWNAR
jgi:hypothetical protein